MYQQRLGCLSKLEISHSLPHRLQFFQSSFRTPWKTVSSGFQKGTKTTTADPTARVDEKQRHESTSRTNTLMNFNIGHKQTGGHGAEGSAQHRMLKMSGSYQAKIGHEVS